MCSNKNTKFHFTRKCAKKKKQKAIKWRVVNIFTFIYYVYY